MTPFYSPSSFLIKEQNQVKSKTLKVDQSILMISSTPPSSSSSNLLAPGFRFHPTDEELVRYYLKRKVSNLPLRVDAIAEIDLYKWEPRDLPSLSRLRSRDMEWYFFSPLDRKYSNRSRTNRATAMGYWKTTGKDRPVKHRSDVVVGMKKTLVFHEGRAPRGQRTNWVMHEYRLESDASSQGSFVLCRIFQKNGTGPQNGAQYGAPFIEEEWEEAEDAKNEGGALDVVMYHAGEQEFVHSDEEKKQILGDPRENTTLLVAAREGQNCGSHADYQAALLVEKSEEPDGRSNANNQIALVVADTEGQISGSHADDTTTLFEDIFDLDGYSNVPGLQDGPNLSNNMGEDSGIAQQFCSPSDQNDGYLELKDIFDNANGLCAGNSFDGLLGVHNDYITAIGANEGDTLPEVDASEFLDIKNGTANAEEPAQTCPLADGVFNLQPDVFLNPVADYPSCPLTEDGIVFYDAPPNNEPSYPGDIFTDMNGIQFSLAADLSGFDVVNDLMAYFDATDNNVPNDIFDSSVKSEFVDPATMTQSNFVSEVEGSDYPTYKENLPVPGTSIERVASSAKSTSATNLFESAKNENTVATDMQVNEGWNTALRKRVVDMLGSVSAPPAKAECSDKGKAVGIFTATHSSSSINVSARMIQVHDIAMMGHAGSWILQKNGEMSLLLSYGMAANDVVGKSVCFEPATEMQSGALPMLLRGGFYLFGLLVLFLSISFKVGMCIYSK